MKKIFFAFCVFAAFLAIGCTKGGTLEGITGNTYLGSAELSGSKVLPAATTNDTTRGIFTGWYDEQTNSMSFTIDYKKDTTVFKQDTLTSISLYKEKPSAAGALATKSFAFSTIINATTKPLPTNVTGILKYGLAGYTQLTEEEKAGFLAGNWYVLLKSRKFPNGLIGGQITVVKR